MDENKTLGMQLGTVITQLNNLHCTAEVLCDSISYAPVDFDWETISNIFDLFSDNLKSAVKALEIIYAEMPSNLYPKRKENNK